MQIKKLSLWIVALSVFLGAIATETGIAAPTQTVELAQRNQNREPRMRGVVKSVVGTQVLVELDRGEDRYMWVGVSQSQLGSLNLMGGTPVYVEGNKIVGLAPRIASAPSSSNFSSRVQALWAEYERSIEEPRNPTVSLPRRSSQPTNVPSETPSPSNEPVPIPGLW
ncbi:hypothetical protein PN462_14935 [Spirulina sp. CS-785/01]|uniref:hypothetical protein n=1 Tax=Spirulina sp. CS-785/01 TaxID=3021716 RepID=UPI00232C9AFE|nr:hypothetical protein [Spirulina sp. CS-785/01]MDB9314405.1 hypothetical protein [Spirulina sp. CS-785/01]